MSDWVLTFAKDQMHRLTAGEQIWTAQAAIVDDRVWVRGCRLTDELRRELVTIADGPLYQCVDGQLIPVNHSVPVRTLPRVDWQPLRQLIERTLPLAAIPAALTDRTSLWLTRTVGMQEPDLLVTDWDAWRQWAETAPDHRLQRLRFVCVAASDIPDIGVGDTERLAFVRGTPCPGLPGRMYRFADHVAVPLGYAVRPPVDAATLLAAVRSGVASNQEDSDFVLALSGESDFRAIAIPRHQWLAARRSNVRHVG